MNKKIIILSGDPNSINSEIIFKSWKKLTKSIREKIIFISNYNLLEKQFRKLNYNLKMKKIKDINQHEKNEKLNILDINLAFKNPFEVNQKAASKFVIESLNTAHKLASNNNIKGIINCAIDKNLLKKSKIGVTEYLASKCGIKNDSEVMLIRNKILSVSPITTHIDIKDISKKLNKKFIIRKIKSLNQNYKNLFNKKPLIGVLGLNPHNAEFRKNSEERKMIIPSIKALKKKGIKVKGPLISDTVFIKDYRNYDILIGMYHDQVLAPFKSIFKFNAINVTLGLKYLRVSPDHGTAKYLIAQNKANPLSLIESIKFVNKFGK